MAGSVRKIGEGRYAVTFESSLGRSWAEEIRAGHDRDDYIRSGIEKIAFDIATNQPSFQQLGLSSDFDAFDEFRSGLQAWRDFQTTNRPADLLLATKAFENALRSDSNFALAHYRLALSLLQAYQPQAASDEFRASYVAKPDFVPAVSWRAYVLYNRDLYYPPTPAALPYVKLHSIQQQKAAAIQIWAQLLQQRERTMSMAQLQQIYYNLAIAKKEAGTPNDYHVAYFFSREAALLLGRVGAGSRDSANGAFRGKTLDLIGTVIDQGAKETRPLDNGVSKTAGHHLVWPCSSASFKNVLKDPPDLEVFGSPQSKRALAYYRQSLALLPGDPVVLCNAATSEAYIGGDTKSLRAWKRTPA